MRQMRIAALALVLASGCGNDEASVCGNEENGSCVNRRVDLGGRALDGGGQPVALHADLGKAKGSCAAGCGTGLVCCPAQAPCAGQCIPDCRQAKSSCPEQMPRCDESTGLCAPSAGGPAADAGPGKPPAGDGAPPLAACSTAGTCQAGFVCCKAPAGCSGKCVPDCRTGIACPNQLTCDSTTGVCK